MTMKQIWRSCCEGVVESSGAMVVLSAEGRRIDDRDGQAEPGRGVVEVACASGSLDGLAVPDQKHRGLAGLRLVYTGLQEPVVGVLEGTLALGKRPEPILLNPDLAAGILRERPEAFSPCG